MDLDFELNDPNSTPTPSEIEHPPERAAVLCAFYALVSKRISSKALFQLTTEVISFNSSSYTAWYWRRKCIENSTAEDLCGLMLAEREFVDDWCCKSPKNYQIWFHRRWLVEKMKGIASMRDDLLGYELNALEDLIEIEPKHYNAWSHRLFVANLFDLFSTPSELDFTEKLIDKDVYNNSAWSYRHHAFIQTNSSAISAELLFCIDRIKLAFHNESPWTYATSLPGWVEDEVFKTFCQSSYNNPPNCIPIALAMVDIHVANSRTGDAVSVLQGLVTVDPIRAYMYTDRICQLEAG